MPRGKKKVEPVEQAQEVKEIIIPETSNKTEFISELKKLGLNIFTDSGVVYALVKKEDISKTLMKMEEVKKKVNYRGSFGATSTKKD